MAGACYQANIQCHQTMLNLAKWACNLCTTPKHHTASGQYRLIWAPLRRVCGLCGQQGTGVARFNANLSSVLPMHTLRVSREALQSGLHAGFGIVRHQYCCVPFYLLQTDAATLQCGHVPSPQCTLLPRPCPLSPFLSAPFRAASGRRNTAQCGACIHSTDCV